jgi:xanthine dehydrogenase accessory factor
MSLVAGRPEADRHTFTQQGERWQYEETLGYADTVYIVGGGHVGLALSRALAPLELRIVVIDERPEVETLKRNRWAHEKCVVPFDSVAEEIPEGQGTYVIIATPQHSADESVLRQLVGKRLRYLGMLGSTTKVRQIMANMREDGFSEEELSSVRSPVGLPIGSHTPAEIAISIAAEIIKVKNG